MRADKPDLELRAMQTPTLSLNQLGAVCVTECSVLSHLHTAVLHQDAWDDADTSHESWLCYPAYTNAVLLTLHALTELFCSVLH